MSRSGVRPAFAIAIAIIWGVLAYLAVSFMTWAAPSLGWLWAALAFLPGLAVAALVWGGRPLGLRLVVAATLALAVGFACWTTMPPSHEHIRDVAADVDLPDGWSVANSHDYGDGWCMEGCPIVEYDYAAGPGATYSSASDELEASLRDQGWTLEGNDVGRGPAEYDVFLTDGRWWVGFDKPFVEPGATIAVTFGASSQDLL